MFTSVEATHTFQSLFKKICAKKKKKKKKKICAVCLVPQSGPTLWDPIDCSPPGSFVHGIFQARILEWVAVSYSGGSSQSRDWTQFHSFLSAFIPLTAAAVAKLLQWVPTLSDPLDGGPPGSPIPGILQARTLEWVAIPFSNA